MHFQNIPHISSPSAETDVKEENFEIFVRLKPILTGESPQVIRQLSDTKLEIVSPYYHEGDRAFQFDKVFSTTTTNQMLFESCILSPIDNVFAGFNSTVLIYGATGAGKTYTMFGDQKLRGIVPKTLAKIFQTIRTTQAKCQLSLSFYQIYNQTIRDLLQEQASPLNIMEDPNRGTVISELSEHILQNQEQALFFLSEGVQHRAMNATKSNQVSSRSHAIFQLTLKQYTSTSRQKYSVTESKLFLIDLAGNQKSFSNCTSLDKRFVQGININKSLLTLGKCINILAERKNQFVPFRDSKLTRILKQSLGGNSKTIMIACVSMQKQFYEQILNTLKYCSLAKNIKNKRVRNIKEVDKSVGFVQMPKTNRNIDSSSLDLLSNLISSVEDKMKTFNILQHLTTAKEKNEQAVKTERGSHQKISQINRFIQQIKKHHEDSKQRIEYFEKQIVEALGNKKSQSQQLKNISQQYSNSQKEIQDLKSQLRQKDKKINLLERSQTTHMTSIGSIAEPQLPKSLSKSTIKINPMVKKSILQIDVKSSFNQQKQNISGASKLFNKKRQIIIDLNSKQSKEQFVQDLKAAQKKIRDPNIQKQIQRLTSLQQLHQFDLNNIQQSIFRKLKFFQEKKVDQQPSSNESRYPLKGMSVGKYGK